MKEKALGKPNENGNNTNSEPKKQVNAPYYIKVNYGANVVTVYKKDSKGKYTVPVKAMLCSCRNCNTYIWNIRDVK